MGDKYISDYEKFLNEMKAKDPAIEEGQRRGRAIFWDKRIDLEDWRRYQQSEVAQPAYVYQNYVGPARDGAEPAKADSSDVKAGDAKPADAKPGTPMTPGTPATNKS